jgi:hypothetical protein
VSTQPDLFSPNISDEDKERLVIHLYKHGWQTRKQLCATLGWSERHVREVAFSMGADIVRGQAGFKLTDQIHRDSPDFPLAMQASDAFISQGKSMIRYSIALRRRLHSLIG